LESRDENRQDYIGCFRRFTGFNGLRLDLAGRQHFAGQLYERAEPMGHQWHNLCLDWRRAAVFYKPAQGQLGVIQG